MIRNIEGIAGYTELRNDLLHLADEWNKKRLELIELQRTFSECVAKLVLASEKVFPKSLDERTADGELKKEFKTDTDVQTVADHVMPSRRNCGLCGKPGHRAPTCPNAHEVQEQEKQTKQTKQSKREAKAKRKRGPVSPERRAQLAKQLQVARAARKGKK